MFNCFKRKRKLKIIKQENGAIVFDKKQGIYFQTNDVGLKILELISNNMEMEEIISMVSEEYKLDFDTAEQDVKDFMSSLKKEGFY